MSTRKITLITEELCGTSFSKSTVSSLCKGLDPIIQDWNYRSLHEHVYPFVLVDAIYTKVREDGRVRSRAVLIEIDEKWMSGRKYLDMAEYWQWRKTKEQGVRSVNQEAPAIKKVG
ncbi:transposase-like protein [Saccharococcus thermophilus]|uniref:Mutator family transposase n=1 Tax=Saccharococcus thermophilus TaxID=29396 RepID=A0A846MIL7_9BACL|nr:transposase-like protein [Saccharococcus thermophilus]